MPAVTPVHVYARRARELRCNFKRLPSFVTIFSHNPTLAFYCLRGNRPLKILKERLTRLKRLLKLQNFLNLLLFRRKIFGSKENIF